MNPNLITILRDENTKSIPHVQVPLIPSSLHVTSIIINDNQNYLEKTEACTAALLTPNTSEIYPNTNPKVMGID